MRLFATCLQALFAAPSFCKGFMSLKLADLRLARKGSTPSMENYWQGSSPCGSKGLYEEDWVAAGISVSDEEKEAIDGMYTMIRSNKNASDLHLTPDRHNAYAHLIRLSDIHKEASLCCRRCHQSANQGKLCLCDEQLSKTGK